MRMDRSWEGNFPRDVDKPSTLHREVFSYSRTVFQDSPSPRIREPQVLSWTGSERNKEMKQAKLSLIR